MKKVLCVICALVIAALSLPAASAVDKAYLKGDADMNGRISINDATHIQRILSELAECNTFWELFTADADNNGVVNVNDVTMLQRHFAQFYTTLNSIPDGNATIAQAAVTMAYEHKDDGYYASGKKIYLDAFRLVSGGDTITRSCDRFVCAAVRWSGADDNYPLGHVGTQADYLAAHPDKWQVLFDGKYMDSSTYRTEAPKGLQPGDIIIECDAPDWRTHTFIYCGEGLIASIFPDSADYGYDITSASYDDTAPQCSYWYLSSTYFRVFRCVKYEAKPKYKNTGLNG